MLGKTAIQATQCNKQKKSKLKKLTAILRVTKLHIKGQQAADLYIIYILTRKIISKTSSSHQSFANWKYPKIHCQPV